MDSLLKKAATAAAATLLLTTGAIAQVDMASCVALAREIATGQTIHFSNNELEALKYYATCEGSSDIDSLGLDIDVIDIVTVGFDLGEDERRQFCETSYEENNISTFDYQQSKVLFDKALNTIDNCVEAARSGWRVEYAQIHQDAISLNVSNNFAEGARLNGIDIIPADAMKCDGAPASFPKLVTTTDYVSMTCIRRSSSTLVDGVTVTAAPNVTLNLRLSDRPFPIQLPGYSSSVIDQLRADIASLETNMSTVNGRVGALRQSLTGWAAEGAPVKVFDNVAFGQVNLDVFPDFRGDCPAGQYVSGFVVEATQHGECHGCVAAVQLICRPLPLPSE